MNARARFDLLCLVISADWALSPVPVMVSILDPSFLTGNGCFVAAEEPPPESQQPAGDKSADGNEETLPNDQRKHAIGNGACGNGVTRHQQDKVNCTNEDEPSELWPVPAQKTTMRSNGVTQSLVMQG